MTIQNKRLITMLGIATIILSIPLIAMQFSTEVKWQLNDFIIIGILLFSTAFTLELIMRTVKTKRKRVFLSILALAVLLLVWIELAVGVFGTPIAGS